MYILRSICYTSSFTDYGCVFVGACKVNLEAGSLVECLAGMEEPDCWDDAELYTVYTYLRCSKQLQLPQELKQILPVV